MLNDGTNLQINTTHAGFVRYVTLTVQYVNVLHVAQL
jgi:hypothetical protein